MSLLERHTWWMVSVVHSRTLQLIRQNVDAVFSDSADDAMEMAMDRNPLRPGQIFGMQRTNPMGRRRAIRVNEKRNDEISDLCEILEKLGISTGDTQE